MEALSSIFRDDLGSVQNYLALPIEFICFLVVFSLYWVASHQQHVNHNAEAEQITL